MPADAHLAGAADLAQEHRPALPGALLWDFDGTLVDSEPSWHVAEARLLAELGGEPLTAEQTRSMVGLALIDGARALLRHAGLDEDDAPRYADVLNDYALEEMIRAGIPFRPGAAELLEEARLSGVPCGLVSMSYATILSQVVDALPAGSFGVVVGGDQVARGKPHPEPYLTAAAALGVEPRDCLVLEDSFTGTLAAQNAGMPTLGVKFEQDIEPGPRRVVVDTLEGLGLDGAAAHWAELRDA